VGVHTGFSQGLCPRKRACGFVQGVPTGARRAISAQERERSSDREVAEPHRGGSCILQRSIIIYIPVLVKGRVLQVDLEKNMVNVLIWYMAKLLLHCVEIFSHGLHCQKLFP
jgi:hypothetical protein